MKLTTKEVRVIEDRHRLEAAQKKRADDLGRGWPVNYAQAAADRGSLLSHIKTMGRT